MMEEENQTQSDVDSVITDTTRDSQETSSPLMSSRFPLLMMTKRNRKHQDSDHTDEQFSPVIPCPAKESPLKKLKIESDEDSEKSESILTYKFRKTNFPPDCEEDAAEVLNPYQSQNDTQSSEGNENVSCNVPIVQRYNDSVIPYKVVGENEEKWDRSSVDSQETRLSDEGIMGLKSLSDTRAIGSGSQSKTSLTQDTKRSGDGGGAIELGTCSREGEPDGRVLTPMKYGGDGVRDDNNEGNPDVSSTMTDRETGNEEPSDSQLFDASQSLFTDTQNSLLSLGNASSTCTNDMDQTRPAQTSHVVSLSNEIHVSSSNESKVSSSNGNKGSSSNENKILSSTENCQNKEDPISQSSGSSRESMNLTQDIADLRSSQNNSEKMQLIFTKIQKIQTSMLRKLQQCGKVTDSEVVNKARKRHSAMLQFFKTLTEIQRNERLNLSVKIKHKKNSNTEALKLKNQFQNLTDRQKQLVGLYKTQEEIEQILCGSDKKEDNRCHGTSHSDTDMQEKENNYFSSQGIGTPACNRNTDVDEDLGNLTPFQCIAAKWLNAGSPRENALFTPKSQHPKSQIEKIKTPSQPMITQKKSSLSTPRVTRNVMSSNKRLSNYMNSPEAIRCIAKKATPTAETSKSCPSKPLQTTKVSTKSTTKLNAADSLSGSVNSTCMSQNIAPKIHVTSAAKVAPSIVNVAHAAANQTAKAVSVAPHLTSKAEATLAHVAPSAAQTAPATAHVTPSAACFRPTAAHVAPFIAAHRTPNAANVTLTSAHPKTPLSSTPRHISTNQKPSIPFKSPPICQMINKPDREISPSTVCSSDVFPVKSSELIRRHQQRLAESQSLSQDPGTRGNLSSKGSHQLGEKAKTGGLFQNEDKKIQGNCTKSCNSQGASKLVESRQPKIVRDGSALHQNTAQQISLLHSGYTTPVRGKKVVSTAAAMRKKLPFSAYVDENLRNDQNVEHTSMTENDDGQTEEIPMDTERQDKEQEIKLRYPALETLINDKILLPAQNVLSVQSEDKVFRASLLENGKIQTMSGEVLKTPVQWLNAVVGGESTKKGRAYREILYAGKSLKSYIDEECHITQNSLEEYVANVNIGPKLRDHAMMVTSETQTDALEEKKSGISESRLSVLLKDCRIRLLSEEDLLPSTDLPENFWTDDFKDVKLTENLWKEVDCWT
ncbi:hypothetical protein FSP39_023999 [Pinctada imbricata]|uniref:RAMA domain-containing protein n=1 Tax=Pinctada imbricata TaxID=66713 RepID=A0AA88XIJ5_PINIB|nr:hypothetical protein FSP39_023999 [Pinctada imbricata]